MDLGQYLDVFIEESKEHLRLCNQLLLLMERQPKNQKLIDEIFRAAHTLKAMAATMGFNDIAQLTHEMENVLDEIRHKRLLVTPSLIDTIFQVVDVLEVMLASIEKGNGGMQDIGDSVMRLQAFIVGQEQTEVDRHEAVLTREEPYMAVVDYESHEQVIIEEAIKQRFDVYRLDISLEEECQMKAVRVFMIFRLLESMGEIIKSVPLAEELEKEQFDSVFMVTFATKDNQHHVYKEIMNISDVKGVRIHPIGVEKWRGDEMIHSSFEGSGRILGRQKVIDKPIEKSVRVNVERLDGLIEAFEKWDARHHRLEQLAFEIGHPELLDVVSDMVNATTDMQSIILNMRKVPAESIFNRFPSMVRRLSKELNKKVELEIEGAATELNRSIMNEVGESVLHVLRNAIDHGIEIPEMRRRMRKPPEGTITIRAYDRGDFVMIEIEDDGTGIDEHAVAKKAVDLGIITISQAEKMGVQEKFELIFASGFSTAQKISDISGRGVGLDAVKSMIESLGGEVMVRSKRGYGSRFTIKLPLT